MLKFSSRLFVFLSVAIFVTDFTFLAINHYFSKQQFYEELQTQSQQIKTAYDIAISAVYEDMFLISDFFANNPKVQQAFLQGKLAVEAEGGGGGKEKAAYYRQLLLKELGINWKALQEKHHIRQLHFHLGPGSTSFLRVHKPTKFGDNMDNTRHIIVDVNRSHQDLYGFETGRVYSGLRSVVPIGAINNAQNQFIHVGALEMGTSFSTVIENLDHHFKAGFAVLLHKNHIESTMWPEAIKQKFLNKQNQLPCKCFLESSSRKGAIKLLSHTEITKIPKQLNFQHLKMEEKDILFLSFPLRDYQGTKNPELPEVGIIIAWKDISDKIQRFRQANLSNLIYAISAFLFIELLLFFAIRHGIAKFEKEVDFQTKKVRHLNKKLEIMAHTDELTQLSNRRYLMQQLQLEIQRCHRHKDSLSLLIFDLDHFKQVNDDYGHLTGDYVLEKIAKSTRQICRNTDLAARYGGEEFCLILPQTDLKGAMNIAERLRSNIDISPIETTGQQFIHITVSIGVTEWYEGVNLSEFINQADQALYNAKESGRNQIQAYPSFNHANTSTNSSPNR